MTYVWWMKHVNALIRLVGDINANMRGEGDSEKWNRLSELSDQAQLLASRLQDFANRYACNEEKD